MNPSKYPAGSLRRKLIVAGIPESQHSLEALASLMPTDFDPNWFHGMSADAIAEVLLYLISKGVVSFPLSGDKALLDLPWGAHVCQFYNSKEDLITLLVPYFKQGLERNEACIWIVAELTVEEATNALAAVVPGLDEHTAKGQMEIRHYQDFYTYPDGTLKPKELLVDQFQRKAAAAAAKSFVGLRASGSTHFIDNDRTMQEFMEYETRVNCAIHSACMMAVCTYPVGAAASQPAKQLIHNHGTILVKRGEWVHGIAMPRDAGKIEQVFTSLAKENLFRALH